jgi:hypothetical protein
MRDIANKTDLVDTLPADAWNAQNNERQNAVESADITLDNEVGPDNDLNMLAKAISGYANAAATYQDSGTPNTYVLALTTNLKPPAKYYDNMTIKFKAGSTNTAASTVNVNSLGAKAIKTIDGAAIPADTIVSGRFVTLTYDNGAGYFVVSGDDAAIASIQPIRDAARNLVVKNNTTNPTYQVDADADEITLLDDDGRGFKATGVSLAQIDITASGADGLDTGSEAASTWYYIWVIYNPTTKTLAGLLSISPTAPTMPSGYTYKALPEGAAVYNDSSSDFVLFEQLGNKIIVPVNQVLNGGVATTYTLINLVTAVPVTAKSVDIYWGCDASTNTNLASFASDTAGKGVKPSGNVSTSSLFETVYGPVTITKLLLTTAQSIYYKLVSAGAAIDVLVIGWET